MMKAERDLCNPEDLKLEIQHSNSYNNGKYSNYNTCSRLARNLQFKSFLLERLTAKWWSAVYKLQQSSFWKLYKDLEDEQET